ncbi:flippase-like domain-containing protein, partial [bacterium]|nr:flippase-like domain-containing protein [bacterium]
LLFLPGLVFGRNAYLFGGCTFLVLLLWAALFLIIMSPRWIRDLLYTINIMLPYRDKIKVLLSGLDPIHRKHALILALIAILHYVVVLVQFYLLVLSFQAVNFIDAVRASAATLFTKAALPISIGGLGVGETASVGFFKIFEVSQAAAFNSSVMLFSMNVLFPAILGFFIMLKLRIVPENGDE